MLWAVIIAAVVAAAVLAAVLAGGSKPREEAFRVAEAKATVPPGTEAQPSASAGKPQASPAPTQTVQSVPPAQSRAAAEAEEGAGKTGAARPDSGSTNSETEKTVPNPKTPENGGTGNSGSKPVHTHNWVEQTKTVHHDAVTKSVHICNVCGAQFDSSSGLSAHFKDALKNKTGCKKSSGRVDTITVQEAYDEKALVKDAWDETVVTGYKCSGCGAVK